MRLHRPAARAALFAASLALCALAATNATADPALPPGFQDEVVFDGLEQPTNFRFAPDGRVFVAEKPGRILVYDDLEATTPALFADLSTDVYETGDRGLLGIALDPKFDEGRPYVYALYTYDHILGDPEPAPKWWQPGDLTDPCPDYNGGDACLVSGRLVRLTAVGNHAEELAGEPVQTVLAEDWCQQFSSHSIGDLQFGPEGKLYVSGGDGASFGSTPDYGELGDTPNPCGDPPGGYGVAPNPQSAAKGGSLRSQDPTDLDGKILRVDPDTGFGVAGNPLFGNETAVGVEAENERRVVAMGFRNPFRFTFDPRTDEIYTDNVGSSEIEEIDRFPTPPTALYNSGWPCYEGPERQYQFETLGLDVCEGLYAEEDDGGEPTAEPFFYYSHGQAVVPGDECPIEYGSALGGISFYEGSGFPAKYKGALFVTDPVRGCVWAVFRDSDGELDPSTAALFMRESHIYPAVDIEEGPEGGFYYANLFGDEEYGDGAIHRITYSPGSPTARLTANPPYGTSLPLHVEFDASESTDPDGQPLTYRWDLDGNGSFETEAGVGGDSKSRNFTEAELEEAEDSEEDSNGLNKVISVQVEDPDHHTSVARVTVFPGDSPPQPEIDIPQESLKWGVGDEIHFHGSATIYNREAEEQESLYEPLGYYWSTRLLHCPTGPDACHGHPLQVFAGTREGEFVAPEHDYPSYIEITLRVADHRGLIASKTIKLEPRAVTTTIASSPPGIELTAGLSQGPAPFGLTSVEGSHLLLSAPKTAEVGGRNYVWRGWSDAGERIHTIVADGSTPAYTATYAVVDEGGPGGGRPTTPTGTAGPQAPPVRAPKATIRSHPPRTTRRTRARFAFVAGERGATFKCKLDRGAYRTCRSPRTYRGLRPGRHTFMVVASGAGGRGAVARFGWRVLPKGRGR
ncbi:MAG TPA: PQQ-dependent sugar dehydrogenase [Solirubrobacterales bacterium]|nr:PQQ-dependent sugar dehydrogenase [Solirubrobacterales bacterium]